MKKKFVHILFIVCAASMLSSCRKKEGECSTCYPNNSKNRAVANAGPDQTITLPVNAVTLDGSASKPGDHNIVTYSWYRVSGPMQSTLPTGTGPIRQVTNMVSGIYQFQLTVTDAAGFYSRDTMQVSVFPVPHPNDNISIISGSATLTSTGTLTHARTVVPATAGDKLLFGGGYFHTHGSSGPTAAVDIYNLSTNTWSTALLSETRGEMTVVSVGNKILYAGGYQVNGPPTSRVDIYDAATDSWSTAKLSLARSQMTTAVAGNKAFFAVGEYSEITTRVDIYDALTNNWSTAELSEARSGTSAIAIGNKVLFAGGYRKYDGMNEIPYDFSTRVDIYDIATNTWSIFEMKESRSGMAAAVAGNKVLFAGGYASNNTASTQSTESKNVEIYDASTNTWSTTTLDVARPNPVAATVGNKVLLVERSNDNAGASGRVDVYDATTNSWSKAVLSQPRGVSSTVTQGNKVLFFTGHPNYNRIDIYDASANTWSAAEINKSLYSTPIRAGNRVFIGGGQVHSIGSYADVHSISNIWTLEF